MKNWAEKLNYTFLDLDYEIKKKFNTTLEIFVRENPFMYERHKIKGMVLKELVYNYKDNIVIAVSPIYYARNFNSLLDLDNVIAFELQDSIENIYDRLVFSDEEDNIYVDNEYKEAHRGYYLDDIRKDIAFYKRAFVKIKNKYFIDNKPVDEVADDLCAIINKLIAEGKRIVDE